MIALFTVLGIVLVVLSACYGLAGWQRLAALRLRATWLVALAGVVQALHFITTTNRFALVLVTVVALASFAWLNQQHFGIFLAAIGICLNMAVMAANGGAMPISPETIARATGQTVAAGTSFIYAKDQVLPVHQTQLELLADRFVFRGPFGYVMVWSIGDLILLLGTSTLLAQAMKGNARWWPLSLLGRFGATPNSSA